MVGWLETQREKGREGKRREMKRKMHAVVFQRKRKLLCSKPRIIS